MNFNAVLLAIVAAVNIWLAAFVHRRNPLRSINKAFSIFALTMAFWTVAVYLGVIARSKVSAFFWIRMSFAMAAFIPASFYKLVCVFPEGRQSRPKDYIFFFVGGLVAAFSFSSRLLMNVRLGYLIPTTIYGPLFPLYILYFLVVFILALEKLRSKWLAYKGIRRLQIQYVFLGVFLELTLASLTNFLGPLVGIPNTEGYGPVFALLMTGCFVYAIARYQLMDIAIVIKKTTLYALLTASITAGYVSIVLFANWLFGGFMGLQTLLPAMIAALLIAFAFAPLKEGIQLFIDKTIFKKRYDHRKILSDLSRILTSIFSLDELLGLILRVITKAMGVEHGAVYLVEQGGDKCIPVAHHGAAPGFRRREGIPRDSPLVMLIMEERRIVLREQMERLPPTAEVKEVVGLLEELGADVCIPIFSKDSLAGLILLGKKESGEMFTGEDIDMFTTLSHHIAVAFENAQLYTKVEESKIYQEILLNSLTSAVIAVDLNNRITAFNTTAEKMLGVRAAEVIGGTIDLLPAALREILADTLAQRISFSAEEVILRAPQGKEVPAAVSSSLFNSYRGEILGALIVFSDLTERKTLEAEMRRADRLASLGTLAAGMAHEIKNPLVSLKTFTQLLPEKYADSDFRENFAKLAHEEVNRINRLVEQLLHFAKPASPVFSVIDLCQIMEDTLTLVGNKFAEQGIEVKKEVESRPLLIMADGDQLRQVLLNIAINAFQAMQPHGILNVRMGRRRLREFSPGAARFEGAIRRLMASGAQECAVVEIADTGKGIDPKDLPHLFDPFFTTKESGVGLGLAIAHNIVREHGGEIDVRSTVGEGTVFTLSLPLISASAETAGV